MTPLGGRQIALGVTGGIAAYKSCLLVRRLREAGATVDVIMTRGATEFVGPVTFEALSGRPVLTSLWEPGRALDHVRLAESADLVVVAPATADCLARAALGIADDLLTAILLARTGPVLMAPAMNDRMYAAAPTQRNLATLRDRGWVQVGPDPGPLAEGDSDAPGRMSEPEVVLEHVIRALAKPGPLRNRTVLVTAGPTREPLDPVRVLTNRSSGRMGYRLAREAWRRGARVILVSGPSSEPPPEGVELVPVDSTEAMERAVSGYLPSADCLLMAAAPADYRPAEVANVKRPRADGNLELAMIATGDILSGTRHLRRPGAYLLGFALETGDAVARGRAKLAAKALDAIVVNDALEPGAGFEVETNRVTIVTRAGLERAVPLQSKAGVAVAILDVVEEELGGRTPAVSPDSE